MKADEGGKTTFVVISLLVRVIIHNGRCERGVVEVLSDLEQPKVSASMVILATR